MYFKKFKTKSKSPLRKHSIKVLIAIGLLFSIQEVSAQTIGAKVGLNLSGVAGKSSNGNTLTNSLVVPGFHLGASFDYPFTFGKSANLLIAAEAGFLLESKGFASKNSYSLPILGTSTIESATSLYYLTFPLIARVGSDLGAVKIYVLTGFSVGVGVYGETVSTNTLNNNSPSVSKSDVNWGEGPSFTYRPLDFGLNFGAGVELNKIPLRLELLFNLGLANIASDQSQQAVLTNRTFAISVGYRFLDLGKNK